MSLFRADAARAGSHVTKRVAPPGPGVAAGRARPPGPLPALLMVLATGVGAVLRFAGIGDKSLWIDEAFSVWISRQPLETMWRITVESDFHPPAYYAALHAWQSAFGDGEVAVRSLSASLSVLTLPVVYLIGQRLGGPALGVVSCWLVALSPLQIAYAQQARMYALMTFCAAVSILSLLVLIDQSGGSAGRPGSSRTAALWWCTFVLSTTSTMLSHNTGVLLPTAIAVFVAIAGIRSAGRGAPGPSAMTEFRRHPLRGRTGVVTGLGAALVLWLPWLPHFWSQSRRVDQEFWIEPPTLATFVRHWHDLVNAYGPEGAYRSYVLVGVVVLVVLGMRHVGGPPAAPLLLVVLVLVPVAVELLVSLRRPIFFTQTLVWTSIPLVLLVAAGILRLRSRPAVALVVAGAVLLNVLGIRGYHASGGKENWRAAVQYLAPFVQPGELVLFNAAWAQIPFDYYYARSDGPPIEKRGLPTDVLERGVLEEMMTPADVPRLDELTRGRSTVWLVSSHEWYTDPDDLVPSRLATSFEAVDSRSFPGITVVRYRAGSD